MAGRLIENDRVELNHIKIFYDLCVNITFTSGIGVFRHGPLISSQLAVKCI